MKKTLFFLFITFMAFCLVPLFSVETEQFYSQCGQDKYLYESFFKNKYGGVFVDIGAHDGITFNNTYFFEKTLGWTGICVEPIPKMFEQLQTNRKAECIQGCISNKPVVTFLHVNGPSNMLSGIFENYDPRHLERIHLEIDLYGGILELLKVDGYDLTQLLVDKQMTHVDYLSLDTEGGELAILKSIDFSKVTIDIIDVENNYQDPEFQKFLKTKGYILVKVINGQDEIYKRY